MAKKKQTVTADVMITKLVDGLDYDSATEIKAPKGFIAVEAVYDDESKGTMIYAEADDTFCMVDMVKGKVKRFEGDTLDEAHEAWFNNTDAEDGWPEGFTPAKGKAAKPKDEDDDDESDSDVTYDDIMAMDRETLVAIVEDSEMEVKVPKKDAPETLEKLRERVAEALGLSEDGDDDAEAPEPEPEPAKKGKKKPEPEPEPDDDGEGVDMEIMFKGLMGSALGLGLTIGLYEAETLLVDGMSIAGVARPALEKTIPFLDKKQAALAEKIIPIFDAFENVAKCFKKVDWQEVRDALDALSVVQKKVGKVYNSLVEG